MKIKTMLVLPFLLAFLVAGGQTNFAQCTTSNGVTVEVLPSAPVQFQFFPLSLLGLGGGSGSGLTAFQQFGVKFTNSTLSPQTLDVEIGLEVGGSSVFSRNIAVTLTIPVGTTFVGVSDFANGNFGSQLNPQASQKPKFSSEFVKKISGGLPSGQFRFPIIIRVQGNPECNLAISAEVLTGATVDLILPTNGTETNSLPLFQWAAVGGHKFRLTVAKLKAQQTEEDALKTSSQRFIVGLDNVTNYQITAGGPVAGGGITPLENNLTWNPGLQNGEYCYRVTMIQEDPTSGTTNEVNSAVAHFTVNSGGQFGPLSTTEIINLLSDIPGLGNLADQLKGYTAFEMSIDGQAATVDDLRNKLKELPEKKKISIKP